MTKDIDYEEAPCGECPCCEWARDTEKHEVEYHVSVAKLWREMATELEDVADLLVSVLLKINNGEQPDGFEEAIEKYRQAKEPRD